MKKITIIQHVCSFSAGPRNVLTKLCLALSALAIRTHSSDLWVRGNQRDVIGTLIDTFVSRGDPQALNTDPIQSNTRQWRDGQQTDVE